MTQLPLKNCYEILNCQPTDSIESIKKSYQTMILKYHPDKQNDSRHSEDTSEAERIRRFQEIDTAWKMLRDPEKRKQYDAEMNQKRFNDEPIVHEKVKRNDFQFDNESLLYVYPCRCGGVFVLPEDFQSNSPNESRNNLESSDVHNDEDDDDIYIECDECSFVVQLLSS